VIYTLKRIIILSGFFFAGTVSGKVFPVGPARTYTAPSKVMNLVSNGDTVEIDAGTYSGDVGTWTKNDLVIRCPNGMAHLDAAGKNAGGKAIWVITGKNTYIENIEFSGCTVPDTNGAGIRQEGANLELRHCYFHDNEDGILTGKDTTSDILFEACEFARNGHGDGYSHNMYIGNIRTFTMRFCYSHHAKIGHCVKSRANNNYILYNRIMDEDTGSASYLINLPNGGFSIVLGNTMMKGPNAQNRTLVDYGSEGLINPIKRLYVVNNTMVSTRPNGATFVSVANGTDSAKIINNIFAGTGIIFSGSADKITNAYSSMIRNFFFYDTSKYDYRLFGDVIGFSPLFGSNPGFAGSFSLIAAYEYVHPTDSMKRNDNFVGAFTNLSAVVSDEHLAKAKSSNFPNPFSERTTLDLAGIEDGSPVTITLYDQLGAEIQRQKYIPANSQIIFERGKLASGIYYYVAVNREGKKIAIGKFIIV
jgi:hypothetical protein